MRLTPRSRALCSSFDVSASSGGGGTPFSPIPYGIPISTVPSDISDTSNPVRPSRLYLMQDISQGSPVKNSANQAFRVFSGEFISLLHPVRRKPVCDDGRQVQRSRSHQRENIFQVATEVEPDLSGRAFRARRRTGADECELLAVKPFRVKWIEIRRGFA